GTIIWQKCIGGSGNESIRAWAFSATSDEGYIIGGYTFSNDGEVSGNHGYSDCWIVKLDSLGNIGWQECLGGSSFDQPNSIIQTSEGGYIIAGQTFSDDGDVIGNHGSTDAWIV